MTAFSSVLLVDPRGWVLLQERDEHPRIDPDTWGFVGGHVEPDEDFEPAAYRETEEETGLRLPPGSLTLWQEVRPWSDRPDDVMQVWVGRTTVTDDDVECHEGRQIVFVEPGAALLLELGGPPSTLLPAFLASDSYRRLL